MMAQYSVPLVIASFGVAVLAAYTALYFGARLGTAGRGERLRWLLTGGLAMGTGVWTMHFVGMRAMSMEVPMTFDTLMTAVSWLAAVFASAVALYIIGRRRIGAGLFSAATLAMTGGIVVMHYLGMFAMRMSAPPQFDVVWLLVSIMIAMGASAAALALCRQIRQMDGNLATLTRLGAALTMAAAICGMHYTGMVAMTFPEGAVPSPDNGLRGDWMGIPLAVFSAAFLAVALFVAVFDIRQQNRLARNKVEETERVARMAFLDTVTGLPNRSGLEQRLLETLAREDARDHPFALLYLDIANYRELSGGLGDESLQDVLLETARALKELAPEPVYIARYSASAFFLMVPDHSDPSHSFMFKRLRELDQRIGTPAMPVSWRVGQSVFPITGNSSRKLIRAAMVPRDLSELGRFDKVKADPDLVLPGQHRAS